MFSKQNDIEALSTPNDCEEALGVGISIDKVRERKISLLKLKYQKLKVR